MSDFDLSGFLPYQLNVLAERTSAEFAEVYERTDGISIAEWRVLAHLFHEGPVSVREIHARASMDKSRVSRAASRLCEAGLLDKRPNESDRRLLMLRLTRRGQALMERLTPEARAFEDRVLARLGPDAERFRQMIDKLLAHDANDARD